MTLALAFCQRDAFQFTWLLGWLAKLSALPGGSLRQVPAVLVVANMKRPIPRQAASALGELVKSVDLVVLKKCVNGWPQGPNAMFQAALSQCAGEDMLWLEPDCVPLNPNWFEQIEWAWATRKPHQHFMGALVEYHWNHCSGVGVYGRAWKDYAPKLAQATDLAWDVFAADQVLPRAKFTTLINHVIYKAEPKSLAEIPASAVLHHPSKDGTLIRLLEESLAPKRKKRAADVLGWERLA